MKMSAQFKAEEFLPGQVMDRITEVRVNEPSRVLQEAAARRIRPHLTNDGRLVIVAADHPGRFVTAAAGDPLAMSVRRQYLARILRLLTQPNVDGIMSTPDVLDELLILSSFMRRRRGESFLDGKVMVGCMNRGGLAGASFEMNDRFGAYQASELKRMRIDGAKMMFRLDLDNPDSGATIQACAEALRQLAEAGVTAFLEPLPVERVEGKYKVIKTAQAMARIIGVATALGNSSRLLWLKVPYVEDYAAVARASTCPLLMLGGGSRDDPREVISEFAAGMSAAGNVRGVLVGRNILFPGDNDPAAMASALGGLVHDGLSVDQAMDLYAQGGGQAPEPLDL
ncbi:MAG TPA: hypothetical protein VLU25_02390 [Acidobacteriota bacterium]|nr:hypothetical protein [Acidobacteriota bacterium]